MAEDKSVLRILSLLSLLHRDMYWSVDRLAQRFGTTKRTIYRDLKDLEQMHYVLVKDDQNMYKIASGPQTGWMPEFDPDEYIYLRAHVAAIKPDHPLRNSILQKINENIQVPMIGGMVARQWTNNILEIIQEAMHDKVCVKLVDYYSLRSDTVSDRIIEPVRFIRGMRYVLGIERDSQQVRQYKIDRMGGAVKLKMKIIHQPDFSTWGVDDFYMNGYRSTKVILGLTQRAASLLCEEYGVKQESLIKQEHKLFPYRYEAPVYGMEGVGRFVMGLIDQVKVYGPERLKTYLRKKYVDVHLE